MHAGGLAGDEQLLGDLPVGVALGDEPQDLELAGGQPEPVEVARVAPPAPPRHRHPSADHGGYLVGQLDERRRSHPLRELERLTDLGGRGGRISCLCERLAVAQQRVCARMRLVHLTGSRHRIAPTR